jgi:hypothetical protein
LTVETKFEEIGARARVRTLPPPRTRTWNPTWLSRPTTPTANLPRLDVRRDRKGEYFDIAVPEGVEVEVIASDRSARHLVLLARLGDTATRRGDKARYLCGHDERHWFVAAIPESYPASTVQEAKVALQPVAVREAAAALPKRKRTLRHNEVYRRQGEWFFIPAPDFEPRPDDILLHNEPLSRGRGSTPHVVADMVRSGGETRWQVVVNFSMAPARRAEIEGAMGNRTLTTSEKERMETLYPDAQWRSVLVNPTAYVRGTVRHSDHATLDLNSWHRVVMSAENQARAASHIVFVD